MILLGVLYGYHILHILHHANRGVVSFAVGADGADIVVADVVAYPALFNFPFHVADCLDKLLHFFGRLSEHE